MTLAFFQSSKKERADKKRYYMSQFDGNTCQVVDSVENREVCVCSNYDDWQDAKKRTENIVKLLNASVSENERTLG